MSSHIADWKLKGFCTNLKKLNNLTRKNIFQFEQSQSTTCSCSLNNIMEMLRNDSVKEILRGPPGITGKVYQNWLMSVFQLIPNVFLYFQA